jgi:hypothetical protein
LEINLVTDKHNEKKGFLNDINQLLKDLYTERDEIKKELNGDGDFHPNDNIWKHVKSTLINKYTFVFECYQGDKFNRKRKGQTNPMTEEMAKEYSEKNPDAIIRLNECDSNYDLEKKMISKEAALTFDIYRDDLTRVVMSRLKQDDSSNLENYLRGMKHFFNLSGLLHQKEQEIDDLNAFLIKMEHVEIDLNGKLMKVQEKRDILKESIEKSMSNIYVQMRFTKSFVEISMNSVVDLL